MNAVLGLVIVLAAATLVSILSSAYGSSQSTSTAALPNLQAIQPSDTGSGLVDILINAVTGFLNNILQAVAAPFLGALDYFTKSTPLMASTASVFNFWLAMAGICNVLLIVIVALLGFHVMSASTFGLDEIEFKHLLPRIGLIFLLMNTSIFFIDGIIALSNALISAVGAISGSSTVWATLTSVVSGAGGQGLAALLMMMVFLIFSVILLVYYVGRLVTLFIGAVLSPLIALVWLVPGFRDFAETAMKTYITTIFVLFVHVVILQLAASLLTGMSATSGNDVPNTLMAMVVGLATVLTLLKTQSTMMQFSYVSMGARNMRKLGGQFMTGVSYMTGKGRAAVSNVAANTKQAKVKRAQTTVEQRAVRTGQTHGVVYQNKQGTAQIVHMATPTDKGRAKAAEASVSASKPTPRSAKTGTTYEAPSVTVNRVKHPNTATTKEKKS